MKLKLALAAALSLALSATAASAYVGDAYTDDNPGGDEILFLGDYNEGFDIEFYGVGGHCGPKGAAYSKMRKVIWSNRGDPVEWYVTNTCDVDYDGMDDYLRICVIGGQGQEACSTYGVATWWWYDEH